MLRFSVNKKLQQTAQTSAIQYKRVLRYEGTGL